MAHASWKEMLKVRTCIGKFPTFATLALALAFAAVAALLWPGVAHAADPARNVSYVGSDGLTRTADEALVLTPDHTDWVGLPLDVSDPSGEAEPETFYYVQSDVTITGAITVTHNINLILGDGATLTIANGINVNSDNDATLQIFPQPIGSGRLVGPTNGTPGQAGIGSGRGQRAGAVTVIGGVIDVVGGTGAAGLGGGAGSIGVMDILGGDITAQGGGSGTVGGVRYTGGAGIGNGGNLGTPLPDVGNLTLQPSSERSLTVSATGGSGAAGIGGGSGNTMHVIIDRCEVEATAGAGAAAIGGGEGAIGSVTIADATVRALSANGVGIGSGNNAGPATGTLPEAVNVNGDASVSTSGAFAGIGGSPMVSDDGELTGFSTGADVSIGGALSLRTILDATALSGQPLARAVAGDVSATYRFAAFGGHTALPPTEVVAVLGGPEPDWAAYGHLWFVPLALTKVSVSPSHAECEPLQPVQFTVFGEATEPTNFPTDQDLAEVLGVTWSVAGASDPATAISADGVFVAGADETSRDITVTATLGEDVLIAWPDLETSLTAEVGDIRPWGGGVQPGEPGDANVPSAPTVSGGTASSEPDTTTAGALPKTGDDRLAIASTAIGAAALTALVGASLVLLARRARRS